ncbi:uncharacterized protein LOC124494548 [Dermatophagoides farinae]|uniref:F-box domain-containing protein n=1 Tax=Dermatophagoides farinae TaxID=6954 RepID=A0A922IDL1_DERFA|nr:hypothetical protein DERF_002061 [Dermatophagoides farinae]
MDKKRSTSSMSISNTFESLPPSSSSSFAMPIQPPERNLLDFPNEILHEIFKFISYEQISKMRLVCHHFNRICSDKLNNEFNSLRNFTQHLFQTVKSQMPRRESARRKHALAREYDIIETLNMRLTLLQMTFSKHIKRNHCCFFPGEIIDEVHRILNYVKQTPVVNRAYKVTDELFDLSTMAMEYFKESIEPKLPDVNYLILDYEQYPNLPSSLSSLEKGINSSNSCCNGNNPKSARLKPIFESSLGNNNNRNKQAAAVIDNSKLIRLNDDKSKKESLVTLDSFVKSTTIRLKRLEKSNTEHNLISQTMKTSMESSKRKFGEYQKQFRKHQTHLDELDRKLEGFNLKFNQILEEMSKMRDMIQKQSASSLMEASTQTSEPHEKSIIKIPVDSTKQRPRRKRQKVSE